MSLLRPYLGGDPRKQLQGVGKWGDRAVKQVPHGSWSFMGVHTEIVQTHISVTQPGRGEPAHFEGHCSQAQLAKWTHQASLFIPESCTLLAVGSRWYMWREIDDQGFC